MFTILFTATRLKDGNTHVERQNFSGMDPTAKPCGHVGDCEWGPMGGKACIRQRACLALHILTPAVGASVAAEYADEFAAGPLGRMRAAGFSIWIEQVQAWVAKASRARRAEK